ncbi:MAG: trigger factor [Chloroflexi bacterium]|nr:trigger factor [Chloroflexota bacterium]
MPVTAERLPRSLVSMEIEVEDERLEGALDRAVRKVSQQVRIPGFRPGKAPRHIVENMVGRPALLQEAIEDLLPGLYSEALEEQEIDAVGEPEIDLKSTEPLVVTAMVPVRPTVDIGDYQSLRVPRDEVTVTDDDTEEAMVSVRRRYAMLEPVDRAVEWEDTVRVDVSVTVEGQGEPHVEEGAEFRVSEDGLVSLPGFLDHLVGLERGGPHEFAFDLPEDYPADELAGKTASYTVTLHEVKQEVLPDLDDDFARSLDEEGIENLEQLQERIAENVRVRIEAENEAAYRDEVIDLLLATADLDYPEVLVEREIDRLVDEQSNHAFHERETFDQWLEAIGQTEDEVRDALREQADLVLRRGLVVGELADRESIEPMEQDVQAEIDELVESMSGGSTDLEERATLRGLLDTEETRGQITTRLLTTQTLERLVEIASQPDEIEPRSPRRRSRRRRGARGGDADEATAEAEDATADDAVAEDDAEATAGDPGDAPGGDAADSGSSEDDDRDGDDA